MSYELYVRDKDGVCQSKTNRSEGGTFVVGGTKECNLNITWNYSKVFYIRILDGKTAGDCIDWLEAIIKILGTEQDLDYWKATNGNVGYTLSIILEWCKEFPEAIIDIY